MGTFDTYSLAWGDSLCEVQTSQMDAFMSEWRLGSRVPIQEADPSEAHSSWAGAQSLLDPFYCILEFSCLPAKSSSRQKTIIDRVFVLGHFRGIFCDWATAGSLSQAELLAARQAHLWTAHHCSRGLAFQLALVQERNAAAERLKSSTFQQIAKAFSLPEDPSLLPSSASSLDLSGISESGALAAASGIFDRWNACLCEVDCALSANAPTTPEERAVVSIASSSFSWGRAQPPLAIGAPSSFAQGSEPASLSGAASPERAMRLLREGFWRLFESDALALCGDSTFLEAAKAEISELCLSRIGAAWACSAMARNPALMVDFVLLGSERIPFVDWIVSRMGLPSRLAEPLIRAGASCGAELLHLCALAPKPHGALFSAAAASIPIAAAGELAMGFSLPASAASLGNPSALAWALGAAPRMGADRLRDVAALAVGAACERPSADSFSCLRILAAHGAELRIPNGAPPSLFEFLSQCERSEIEAGIATGANERSSPRL